MLTRRETQQIVNWVLREIQKRNYPLSTDNKIDLSLATTGKIRGGTIRGLGVGASAYVADISFTPVDYDTITWSPGNISLLDGRNQTVASGYATISGTTYLYCDWGDDEVKTTTTYSGALGYNRVFVGVASSSDDTVSGMAYVANPYSSNILITTDKVMDNLVTELKLAGGAVTADKIAANAVTSQKIYAGEIDALKVQAAQIYALSLSAISANLGTITAGDIYGVTISGSTIYAGEGDVVLNVSGIQIYGEMLDFYDDTVSPSQQGAIWGYSDTTAGLAVCGKTELYLCLGEAMADVAYMMLYDEGILIIGTGGDIDVDTTDTLNLRGYTKLDAYSRERILISTDDTYNGGITISTDSSDVSVQSDDININSKVDLSLSAINDINLDSSNDVEITAADGVYINSADLVAAGSYIRPAVSSGMSLGTSSYKWNDVYCVTLNEGSPAPAIVKPLEKLRNIKDKIGEDGSRVKDHDSFPIEVIHQPDEQDFKVAEESYQLDKQRREKIREKIGSLIKKSDSIKEQINKVETANKEATENKRIKRKAEDTEIKITKLRELNSNCETAITKLSAMLDTPEPVKQEPVESINVFNEIWLIILAVQELADKVDYLESQIG